MKKIEAFQSLNKSIPVSYVKDFTSFNKSINISSSNLTKAARWKKKPIERVKEGIPCPSSYNLSYLDSISKNAAAKPEHKFRNQYGPFKRYDKFKNKTYFKELDRGGGEESPGPWRYNAEKHKTINLPNVRKSWGTLFGGAKRGLHFKKEDKDSPSPTKYNVQYEFKGTDHKKGYTFGSAAKKFSLF